MIKKVLTLIFTSLIVFALLTGCGKTANNANPTTPPEGTAAQPSTQAPKAEAAPVKFKTAAADNTVNVAKKGTLLMATTTSTDNTGLLDYLAPKFLKDTGWELKWTAVGTGEAIAQGKNGDVDIVLCHAKAQEEDFVKSGFGVERFQVMYNDFIVVGPKDGAINKTGDLKSVFSKIQNDKLVFVSRGDNSGTYTKEASIWKSLNLDVKNNPNYISAGAGMSDTLIMADEKKGYALSDRGTWLTTKSKTPDIAIICEGDAGLLNQYGVIAVSKQADPKTNLEAANAFITWICSPDVQKTIGQFGVEKYGESLFTPNAVKK